MIKYNFCQPALVFLVLLVTGCSTPSKNVVNNHTQAWLEPGTRITLPPPGITPAINSQQLLTGTFNGQTQSLVVVLKADEQKIVLAGLSSLGIRLFLLSYDSNGVHTEQSVILPQLPPANQVLADVMLSHWPIAVWLPRLPTGWTLTDKANKRELRNSDGKLVTEISYLSINGKRQPVSIEQYAFKYHLIIQNLDE